VKSNEEREKLVRHLQIDLKGNEQLFKDMELEIECILEKLGPEQIEINYNSLIKGFIFRLN